jgi:hypothetical protein
MRHYSKTTDDRRKQHAPVPGFCAIAEAMDLYTQAGASQPSMAQV